MSRTIMAVDHLQAKGYRAPFVEGGIADWKAAGGAVVSKTKSWSEAHAWPPKM